MHLQPVSCQWRARLGVKHAVNAFLDGLVHGPAYELWGTKKKKGIGRMIALRLDAEISKSVCAGQTLLVGSAQRK
jgi:hypothetical protein